MKTFDDKNDAATVDDLHDRLVDQALREIVGTDAPPDLSERILEMKPQPVVASTAAVEPGRRFGRPRWLALTVAAMLVLCAVPLMLPQIHALRSGSRDVARSAAKISDRGNAQPSSATPPISPYFATEDTQRYGSSPPTADGKLPSPYHMTEDVQYQVPPLTTAPQSVPSDNIGSQGRLISDAAVSEEKETGPSNVNAAATPNFQADVDVPFRQGSFGAPPSAAPVVLPLGDLAVSGNGLVPMSEEISSPVEESQLVAVPGTPAPQMSVTPRILIEEDGVRLGVEVWGLRKDKDTELGTGPALSGDQYTRIVENPFIKAVGRDAVSTFSIDVDTASYSNVRQFLMQLGQLPPADAVRIEELVNYFEYDYAGPTGSPLRPPAEPGADGEHSAGSENSKQPAAPGSAGGSTKEESAPFAAHVEVAGCPWAPEHRLVRIGIKGREMDRDKRPQSNLVFLVDVSGSMNEPSKLPLVVQGLEQLTRELGENDRVAIVVYASSEGLVLPSTPGTKQQEILAALSKLQAGGSTAGGAGIQLAYQIAEDNFIEGGVNRVILCTDGDFNVGVTSSAELERLVEQKAKDTKVFLSVLGFGRGNLNDAMMEAISNRGNGNYFYVDNRTEAKRVLVEQMTGTLVTIAKDVKIQVEFNPRQVAGYRLLGYENRMLRTEDFNDDKKDAGEIGAGHTVTALYEVVPAGKTVEVGAVDELKYQQTNVGRTIPSVDDSDGNKDAEQRTDRIVRPTEDNLTKELLTLKMRYKAPEGDVSEKLEWPAADDGKAFAAATTDFQFAASVAGFGLLLRDSQYKGNLTYGAALEVASSSRGSDEHGYRGEFVEMVRKAKELRRE